ncbi:MAG: HTH domain-containing protein, partial [Tannerella sp.]|nr:HTH domain-containing protein [Tannerella sp.]
IEGDISFEEVKNRIDAYYKTQVNKNRDFVETKENTPNLSDKNVPVNNEKFPVKDKKFPVIGLEIMKLMEINPNITIMELSKQLNISDRAIKNNINKLRNVGIISRVGSDKTGHWKILINEKI